MTNEEKIEIIIRPISHRIDNLFIEMGSPEASCLETVGCEGFDFFDLDCQGEDKATQETIDLYNDCIKAIARKLNWTYIPCQSLRGYWICYNNQSEERKAFENKA